MNRLYNFIFFAFLVLGFLSCKEENEEEVLRVAFNEFGATLENGIATKDVYLINSASTENPVTVTLEYYTKEGVAASDYISLQNSNGESVNVENDQFQVIIPADQDQTYFTVTFLEGYQCNVGSDLVFTIAEAENAIVNETYIVYELIYGGAETFFSLPYTNDFEECTGAFSIPDDFIEAFSGEVKMDRGWACTSSVGINGSIALRANAFGGDTGEEDAWLITRNKFDLSSEDDVIWSFDVKSAFDGPGTLTALYSTDYCGGDPALSNWIALDIEEQLPLKGSNAYKSVELDLSSAAGLNVFLALQFSGANNEASASFEIDNFSVVANDDNGGGGTGSSFSTDFETCSEDYATPSGFIEVFVPGSKEDRGWGCRSFGIDDSRAVQASAYGGEDGNDNAWLIVADQMDFSGLSSVNFQFSIFSNFSGPGEVIVQYSEDYSGSGNPEIANWTSISAINDAFPTAGSQEWISVDENVTSLGGKQVYIAFQWVGANQGESSSWAIDNLAINDPDAFSGGGGSGGGSGGSNEADNFYTDFEGCTADYATPSGFIEEFVPGSKEDRGWGCRAFGIDDSRAVQASAYGGADGTDNAWLIIDSKLDFSALSSVNFQFSVFSNYSGPGEVIVQYSEDYSGTGNPENANWTSISAINDAFPTAGSQEWLAVNEDLTELAGKEVYIAFQWVGANQGESSSWAIDNLAINAPGQF
jgi:hypothetical protein